jgi:hypothetical protein
MAKSDYATLIGDLVRSREASSRVALQAALEDVLGRANELLEPVQPLETTVGDEFQGVFLHPADAVKASLLLRLLLLKEGEVDARFGLGFGEVNVFKRKTPISQDGSGWWSARTAIERVAMMAEVARTEFVRTYLESWRMREPPRSEIVALNSHLLCRDALVSQMKARSRRLLLGLILEVPQAILAAEEKISQSAVSQNLANSGAYAIWTSELELEGRLF